MYFEVPIGVDGATIHPAQSLVEMEFKGGTEYA